MRPEKLPSWCDDDDSAKVVEPSDTKKLQGWIYKERVPFQFWNWTLRHFVKWITHFDRAVNHFDPHEATFPNMTVVVNAGRLQNGTILTEVPEQATPTIVAPTADPRIDRILIDRITGDIEVITGTETASPAAPAIPESKIIIAQVLLQTTTTEITGDMIADERGEIIDSRLLSEYTVTGSAVTSIDFTGLDINTHKSYRVEIDWHNPTGASSNIRCDINGDTTASNYFNQTENMDDTTDTHTRGNNNFIANMGAGGRGRQNITIALLDDGTSKYAEIKNFGSYAAGAAVTQTLRTVSHTVAQPNITQVTFTGSANSISIGSKIRVYRGDM